MARVGSESLGILMKTFLSRVIKRSMDVGRNLSNDVLVISQLRRFARRSPRHSSLARNKSINFMHEKPINRRQ